MAHHPIHGKARVYTIVIQGQLDESWSDWLAGMDVHVEGDRTHLRGLIQDQAALRGILSRILDMNLVLLAIDSMNSYTTGAVGGDNDV